MSFEPKPDQSPDSLSDQFNQLRELELSGYEAAVKKARNALFWTAGLVMFWVILFYFINPEEFGIIDIGFGVVCAAVFAGLALYTKTKPYTALVAGIIAFAIYIALGIIASAMVDGAAGAAKAAFSGIIVKVLIFVNLIRPLKDAKELQHARENKF